MMKKLYRSVDWFGVTINEEYQVFERGELYELSDEDLVAISKYAENLGYELADYIEPINVSNQL